MLKPTIKKLKDLRGRIKGYRARYGVLTAEGETAKAAELNVETHVLQSLMRLDAGTLIGTWRGATYVVAPDTSGWRYWTSVFSRPDYWVTLGTGTKEDAIHDALSHTAKTIWHRHWDDTIFVEGLPVKVQKELIWYFNWQRAYAVAVEQGHNDTQARAIADKVQQTGAA